MIDRSLQKMVPFYRSTTLYVGDLHPNVTEDTLYERFSTVGQVLCIRICRDVISNTSLGYAYVNYFQPIDAERALDTMNFQTILGRPMRIMWSMRDPSLRRSGIGNVFIKNLNEDIAANDVYYNFSKYGRILSCKVATDETGSKGYGFVHFETDEAARQAIEELNGKPCMSKKLYVSKFIPRRERIQLGAPQVNRSTNVYVKNFRDKLDDGKLRKLFERFGEITSAKVMTDESGASKGFGFVNFKEAGSAENAVSTMNGTEIYGLQIYAGFSQKKAVRHAELRKKFSCEGANLYVKNLDNSVDDAILHRTFSEFGTITSAKVMMANGRSKGFGFVCFSTRDAADMALKVMKGKILKSKPMYISWAERKEDRKKQLTAMYMKKRLNLAYATPQQVAALFQANDANYVPTQNPMYYPSMTTFGTHYQTTGTATNPQDSTYQHMDATQQIPAGVQTTVHNNLDSRSITKQTNAQRGATPKTTTVRPPATNLPPNRTGSSFKSNQMAPVTVRAGMLQPNHVKGQQPTVIVKRKANYVPKHQNEMLRGGVYHRIHQLKPNCDDEVIAMVLEHDDVEMLKLLASDILLLNRVEEASAILEKYYASPRDVNDSKNKRR